MQHAGIASGFFQTQLLDSIYNMFILLNILARMGINIEKVKMKVQDDDSIIALTELIPPLLHQSFSDYLAQQYLGAILNIIKSKISNQLNGLSLVGFTNQAGIPVKLRDELLANLLYPERKSDENKLMVRAIDIAYANCGYDPFVYRICENIYNYLRYKGFPPNASGLPHWLEIFKNSKELTFRSFFSTYSKLTRKPARNPNQIDKLWPSAQFINRY